MTGKEVSYVKEERGEAVAEKERAKKFKELNLVPGTIVKIPLVHIRPNPHQPRKFFKEEALDALTCSLDEGDVDCPVQVTVRDTHALIVDGERRFRSARSAGMTEVSCQICEVMDEKKVFLKSVRAYFGKEGMSPVESARAIEKLMSDNGWSQAEAARQACMSPSQVSQVMKYLNLTPEIQDLVIRGEVANGVAGITARYPKEIQLGLLKKLLGEREKLGGKIDQNAAARIAQAEAELQGCKPLRAKRGKQETLCHADAVVKNVMAKAVSLEKAINEMISAEHTAGSSKRFFNGLKTVNILGIEAVLKVAKKKLDDRLRVISENA